MSSEMPAFTLKTLSGECSKHNSSQQDAHTTSNSPCKFDGVCKASTAFYGSMSVGQFSTREILDPSDVLDSDASSESSEPRREVQLKSEIFEAQLKAKFFGESSEPQREVQLKSELFEAQLKAKVFGESIEPQREVQLKSELFEAQLKAKVFGESSEPQREVQLKAKLFGRTHEVHPLNRGDFTMISALQQNRKYGSSVDLMAMRDEALPVAVKRMPLVWTRSSAEDFVQTHKTPKKNPWVDIAVIKYLNSVQYPYVCKHVGVFQDLSETWVVSSFAAGGDLFNWVTKHCTYPSCPYTLSDAVAVMRMREVKVRPIAKQVARAVAHLHDLDIAHCFLTVENIVLTCDHSDGTLPEIQLVDFAGASIGKNALVNRSCVAMYQAPETYEISRSSPFPWDMFALGVIISALVTGRYLWFSTEPGACKKFSYVQEHGFRALLSKATWCRQPLSSIFTSNLMDMLENLLSVVPHDRCKASDVEKADWM